MMSFNRLNFVTPGIAPIAVHLERNVSGDRALAQCSYHELADMLDGPLRRWSTNNPVSQMGKV